MLLCIVYAMLFVDTVNTKINHTISPYCRYKTRISNAFNVIYVDTVNTLYTEKSTVFTPHYSVYSVV